MLAIADELKVIVFNKQDFDWAEQHTSFLKSNCLQYLQPEWSKASILMSEIVEFVKINPQWKISLQTHKYMHIP